MSLEPNPPGGPKLHRVLGLRDLVLLNIAAIVGLRWLSTAAQIGPSSLVLTGIVTTNDVIVSSQIGGQIASLRVAGMWADQQVRTLSGGMRRRVEIARNEQRYLTALLEEVRAAIKQGLGLQQTIESAVRSERAKWVLFDTINRRNIGFVYLALEWE